MTFKLLLKRIIIIHKTVFKSVVRKGNNLDA